jgi:prevent-host-death family protein
VTKLTATEVAREFSAIVNRVGAGEEIEVTRNGTPVMQLCPVRKRQVLSARQWGEVMASLPPVDDDLAGDLEEARREIGDPSEDPWPS